MQPLGDILQNSCSTPLLKDLMIKNNWSRTTVLCLDSEGSWGPRWSEGPEVLGVHGILRYWRPRDLVVSGVLGVPKVSEVPGVPKVPRVPEVLGVPGVPLFYDADLAWHNWFQVVVNCFYVVKLQLLRY